MKLHVCSAGRRWWWLSASKSLAHISCCCCLWCLYPNAAPQTAGFRRAGGEAAQYRTGIHPGRLPFARVEQVRVASMCLVWGWVWERWVSKGRSRPHHCLPSASRRRFSCAIRCWSSCFISSLHKRYSSLAHTVILYSPTNQHPAPVPRPPLQAWQALEPTAPRCFGAHGANLFAFESLCGALPCCRVLSPMRSEGGCGMLLLGICRVY